jgi:hypothetical protein
MTLDPESTCLGVRNGGSRFRRCTGFGAPPPETVSEIDLIEAMQRGRLSPLLLF